MKKDLIKVGVISGLVGSIICGGIGSVVAYNIAANQIEYTPQSAGWKVNSVSEAIDSLYISKAGENYSTDEKVVGTWIDGKPIYQKTFANLSMQLTADVWYDTGLDATNCVPVSAVAYAAGTDNFVSYLNVRNHNNNWKLMYPESIGVFTILTIQYTKTTDTAPNQAQTN